eukprot:scaffold10560_cov72-Phaeocystis_antarctica.AAC.2
MADCRMPYCLATWLGETYSLTRKGSTGTSTVLPSCASMMIAYGPQMNETGAHLFGLHDLAKPSGRWTVIGTQTSSWPDMPRVSLLSRAQTQRSATDSSPQSWPL